jgi:hypothetical protein
VLHRFNKNELVFLNNIVLDVGLEITTTEVIKGSVFCNITPWPSTFIPMCFSDCSSTLKMEAICFWETSVEFQRTTPCYVPDGRPF